MTHFALMEQIRVRGRCYRIIFETCQIIIYHCYLYTCYFSRSDNILRYRSCNRLCDHFYRHTGKNVERTHTRCFFTFFFSFNNFFTRCNFILFIILIFYVKRLDVGHHNWIVLSFPIAKMSFKRQFSAASSACPIPMFGRKIFHYLEVFSWI
ncbi:hypothetical protein PUN28_011008 [Cardiocondyla obscurior]|uniref:Uncharacterized protein n=1 Tax=Cardiocondyla obscurior TaxID=286306 RepID=A0AAW2FKR8_9HYME